jgi:hypothetical protein
MDGPGLEYRQGQKSFFLSTASRTGLGPIRPPIHWALEGLYQRKIPRNMCWPLNTIYPIAKATNQWNYTSNSLYVFIRSTGTTLRFEQIYLINFQIPQVCWHCPFSLLLNSGSYWGGLYDITTSAWRHLPVCVQLNDRFQMDFTITARILLQSVYIHAASICLAGNTRVWYNM